jgi:pimeloyl-ACP methyl ester carboxylesterase
VNNPGRVLALVALTVAAFILGPIAQARPASQTASILADQGVTREWVRINSNVKGLLYQPTSSVPDTALLVMHPESDFTEHFTCAGMAQRGFMVLCVNGRGTRVPDELALDVKAPVNYLRARPGIDHVILIGHSGGGPTMAYYQDVAENGLSACAGPEKIAPCSSALADMAPADAVILLDAHHGSPLASLFRLDPGVLEEDQFGWVNPSRLDPSVDPFDSANGYDPSGNPTYSEDFLDRFFAGQSARRQRQMDLVQARLALLESGQGMFPDNEPLLVARNGGRIWEIDRRLISHTKEAQRLLTPDGIVTTVVQSIRPRLALNSQSNLRYAGADKTDLNDFMQTAALRTAPDMRVTVDDIVGIDWSSQNGLTPGSLAGVHVPVLNISASGHYWVVPNEISHRLTASADKELLYIEGATHGFTPCDNCVGSAPGKYDRVQADTLNYMEDWIRVRFGS